LKALNAGIDGLGMKLVPIAALSVRVCRYLFPGDGARLIASEELSPEAGEKLGADTNRLLMYSPPPGNGGVCPDYGPGDYLTFANETQRVSVNDGVCGLVGNGVFAAAPTQTWLDDLQHYTTGSTTTGSAPIANVHASTTSPEAAAACVLPHLAFEFFGGGVGAGNEFATIVIRDISPQPCLLQGEVTVSGIDWTGRVVTQTVTYPTAPNVVLSAHAPEVPNMQPLPAGEVVGELLMSTDYRDDSTSPDALCHANHVIVPASWQLTLLGGIRNVANLSHDPDPQWPRLLTCRGEIDTTGKVQASDVLFPPGS